MNMLERVDKWTNKNNKRGKSFDNWNRFIFEVSNQPGFWLLEFAQMSSDSVSDITSPRLNALGIETIRNGFLNDIRDLGLKPSHYKTVNLINCIVDQHGIGPEAKLELLTALSNKIKDRYNLEHITDNNIDKLYDNLVILYLKVRLEIKTKDDLNKLVASISSVVVYINRVDANKLNFADTITIQNALTKNYSRKELQLCLTESNLTDKGKNLVNKIIDKSQDDEDVGQIDVMQGEHDRKIFLGLNKCSITLLIIAFFLLSASFITLWALFEFDIIPTKDKNELA